MWNLFVVLVSMLTSLLCDARKHKNIYTVISRGLVIAFFLMPMSSIHKAALVVSLFIPYIIMWIRDKDVSPLFNKGMLLVYGVFITAVLSVGLYMGTCYSTVRINEVCSNNNSILVDENVEYTDYIELYNPTSKEISLDGYYLSDDDEMYDLNSLEGYTIPSKGYLLLYLSDFDFALSKTGDIIYLSDKDGRRIDEVEIPALDYDVCYIRYNDKLEWGKGTSSPGESNKMSSPIYEEILEKPEFSIASGVYSDTISIAISSDVGADIYYTTDGSSPNMLTDKYVGDVVIKPEEMGSAVVLRAIAYDKKGKAQSAVVTQTYFFEESDSEFLNHTYTVSVSIDENDLYDYYTGIYVPGVSYDEYVEETGDTSRSGYIYNSNWKQGWKRLANIEMYDANHNVLFDEETMVSIHGNSSITQNNKSFNIYAIDGTFVQNLFNDVQETSSMLLRNGGSEYLGIRIRDGFITNLAVDRDVSVQNYYLCNTYLNGTYIGGFSLQEKYSREYIINHFGLDENSDITIIKTGATLEGKSVDDYWTLISFIENNDMTISENYEYVESKMDIQSFIDYCCIGMYVANVDFYPCNNYYLWKSNAYDGKWRWMLQDFDECAGHSSIEAYDLTSYKADSFVTTMHNESLLDDPVFVGLMSNPDFKQQFVTSMLDIANENYSPYNVNNGLDEINESWFETSQRAFVWDRETFESELNILSEFFENRLPYVIDAMIMHFDLSGETYELNVNVNNSSDGYVTVNTTTPTLVDNSWTGTYVSDYPVTVTAVPNDGYKFVGWTGDVVSDDITITISGNTDSISVEAIFEEE